MQTEGGHQHQTGGTASQHPPSTLCRPTSSCHPTIHNAPTHHHYEGGADEGYPTTRTAQTDTHPHRTAGHDEEQCTIRQQYSAALHWG